MEYNTTRTLLPIKEYGRNVYLMAQHLLTITDKAERTKAALTVIEVMAQLNQSSRDASIDFRHKLWDHLHMMCGYQLDVESPYPTPPKPLGQERPEALPYPKTNIRIKHYGKILEKMIDKALEMPEGAERTRFVEQNANMMKHLYRSWNKSIINDEEVLNDLKTLSKGRIVMTTDEVQLEVLKDLSPRDLATEGQHRNNKKKRPNNNNRNFYRKRPR